MSKWQGEEGKPGLMRMVWLLKRMASRQKLRVVVAPTTMLLTKERLLLKTLMSKEQKLMLQRGRVLRTNSTRCTLLLS